jgi:hypothetical protein
MSAAHRVEPGVNHGGVRQDQQRTPFPVLDVEPPPRSWKARALRGALVAAAVAIVAGGAYGIASSVAGGSHPSAAARVVVMTDDGRLALVTLGQAETKPVPRLGPYQQIPPAISADGRYLVADDGTVIALSSHGVSVKPANVRIDPSRQQSSFASPLADHDGAVVVLDEPVIGPPTPTTQIAVLPLASGRPISLGGGDVASGDPQALGAIVSVAAPGPAPATTDDGPGQPADARVERRDVGRVPVILGTAPSLEKALGEPTTQPVALDSFPDAAGDLIAITVTPVKGNGGEGIVVVDRSGHVVSVLSPHSGAYASSSLAWSPDSSEIAFGVALPADAGAGIGVWAVGRGFTSRDDPQPGVSPAGCLWSPDGVTILCQVFGPSGSDDWVEAVAAGGPVADIAAPGALLAWLPRPKASQ